LTARPNAHLRSACRSRSRGDRPHGSLATPSPEAPAAGVGARELQRAGRRQSRSGLGGGRQPTAEASAASASRSSLARTRNVAKALAGSGARAGTKAMARGLGFRARCGSERRDGTGAAFGMSGSRGRSRGIDVRLPCIHEIAVILADVRNDHRIDDVARRAGGRSAGARHPAAKRPRLRCWRRSRMRRIGRTHPLALARNAGRLDGL
jgi:hypothetical protein